MTSPDSRAGTSPSSVPASRRCKRRRCSTSTAPRSACSPASDVKWGGHGKPDSERSLIERIKNPMTVLGHGRDNWKLEHLPVVAAHAVRREAPRVPPHATRALAAPGGCAIGSKDCSTSRPTPTVVDAQPEGDKVRLVVASDGDVRDVLTEYVVLGTGYDVDVDRIAFIDPSLAARVARIERAPRLDRHFQSSVPGSVLRRPVHGGELRTAVPIRGRFVLLRAGRVPSSIATRSVAPSNAFRRNDVMKVLVTGHHGFIGSVMVPTLLDAGHEVVGLDTDLYGDCPFGHAPEPDIPSIRADIRDVSIDDLDRVRCGRPSGRAVERPARRSRRGAHVRHQRPRDRSPRSARSHRRRGPVPVLVVVQQLRRRRRLAARRRRGVQSRHPVRRVEGAGRGRVVGAGERRLQSRCCSAARRRTACRHDFDATSCSTTSPRGRWRRAR